MQSTLRESHPAVLFAVLALALFLSRVGGRSASKAGLPSVLGELSLGIILGTIPGLGDLIRDPAFKFMMEFGAVLLLFEVGLESSFSELRKVGVAAGRVALLGMAAPLALGVGVSIALQATQSLSGHIFIGATLAATSVGISARVFRDLGLSRSREARIILAAAVFDDILGLILLALVSALVSAVNGTDFSLASMLLLFGEAMAYVFLVLLVGPWIVSQFFGLSARVLGRGGLLVSALSLCLAFSALAHLFGLAPIMGAFFAGLIIQPYHFEKFRPLSTGTLEDQLEPLSSIFVPLFFVLTGMQVSLWEILNPRVLVLGLALSVAAILGKVVAGWAAGKNCNRLVVGIGMIPRGEVGLVFASIGASITLGGKALISPKVFGAVILMVAITSFIAPFWLGILLGRGREIKRST